MPIANPMNSREFLQPIDRTALALILVLTLLISLLASSGEHAAPRVRDFSWRNQQLGAQDTAFTMTFTRPMDRASVEANLVIEPLLPGKISWAGRRMAYTLISPAPYGTEFQVKLAEAREQFSQKKDRSSLIKPFVGKFSTRDRAFIYLGIEGKEQGQLILYNLTKNQKIFLTPEKLSVIDFKTYPAGDRILFSAQDRLSIQKGTLEPQLYTVTTGINYNLAGKSDTRPVPSGVIELVLDSQNYQNLKFDLSADGQTIVVQRVNRRNPAELGLWTLRPGSEPQLLQAQPGGDFLIAPDSTSVAMAQGQGIVILPLQPEADPLEFLAKFGMVLNFTKDGSGAVMVKFNTDYTRSLFFVTNQGVEKELLRTTGSILSCEFAPQKQNLYCLLTQLVKGEQYQEQPYLAEIDLQESKVLPLLLLPIQRDIQMSLSPDGFALLFDQIVSDPKPSTADGLRTNEGQAIATSHLWLMPLTPAATGKLKPEQLPLPGLHPRWLP